MKLSSTKSFLLIFLLIAGSIVILYHWGIISHHLHFLNYGYRLSDINEFTEGHRLSGQWLIGFKANVTPHFYPVENLGDDRAVYYVIPFISDLLHISTASTYLLFFCSCVAGGFSISIIGIRLFFTDKKVRLYSSIYMVFVALVMLFVLDVYVLAYMVTSFIPLLYWVARKYVIDSKLLLPFALMVITGFMIGIANEFRIYSGYGLSIVVVLYLLLENKLSWVKRVLFIVVMAGTIPLFGLYLSAKVNQRNEWMKANGNCTYNTELKQHVIWHSMYTGLGIIKNKYGIEWCDTVVFEQMKQANTALKTAYCNLSPEYESTVKQQYLNVLKKDPLFVAETVLLKLLYCTLFVVIFFNYGMVLLWKTKASFKECLPLLAGIVFYILPGVLTYPYPMYMLGAFNLLAFGLLFLANKAYSQNA